LWLVAGSSENIVAVVEMLVFEKAVEGFLVVVAWVWKVVPFETQTGSFFDQQS
jgi:hypothetical protein